MIESTLKLGSTDQPDKILEQAAIEGPAYFTPLRTSVERFQILAGCSAHQIESIACGGSEASEAVKSSAILVKSISNLTQQEMRAMNEQHPGIPPDSLQLTLNMVTRQGAFVVVLHGRPDAGIDSPEEVLGYGIGIRGKENFPEFKAKEQEHAIPESLIAEGLEYFRVNRLFIRDSARDQESAGKAFDLLFDGIKAECREGVIVVLLLTDLRTVGGNSDQSFDKRVWLEANQALLKRGAEHSAYTCTVQFQDEGRPDAECSFVWGTYPPRSELVRARVKAIQKNFSTLEKVQRSRLAPVLSALPSAGETVLHLGTIKDGFDIASATGNRVLGVIYKGQESQANRPSRRSNFEEVSSDSDPKSPVDAVVINGVLPDLATLHSTPLESISQEVGRRCEFLTVGGALIIRDTVGPITDQVEQLTLSKTTPCPWDASVTVAELFRQFVNYPMEGSINRRIWEQVRVESEDESCVVYSTPSRITAEFLAKVRYSQSWEEERGREFTLHSAPDRIALGKQLGLRLLAATPEYNPFILGQFREAGIVRRGCDGRTLDPLPTNHISVWQKVGPREVISVRPGGELDLTNSPFVSIRVFQEKGAESAASRHYEVASRQGLTLDVVPYGIRGDKLYLWGRVRSRPLLTLQSSFDGTVYGGFVAEQLAGIVNCQSFDDEATRAQQISAAFCRASGVSPSQPLEIEGSCQYFPKADMVDELVVAAAVKAPRELSFKDITVPGSDGVEPYTLRAFDAHNILQGRQVAHAVDARLERIAYRLLLGNNLPLGPWLGEQISLREQAQSAAPVYSIEQLLKRDDGREFVVAPHGSPRFLVHHRRQFIKEYADRGANHAEQIIEYVEGASPQTASVLPVARLKKADGGEEVVVMVKRDDLPAAHEKYGSSILYTTLTSPVPSSVMSYAETVESVTAMLTNEGLHVTSVAQLGGKYAVSPGITPHIMIPLVAEIDLSASKIPENCFLVPLKEVVESVPQLRCGQLITAAYRLFHSCCSELE